MTHYWHEHNPWKERIVYLPDIKEVSACINPEKPFYYYEKCLHIHDLRVDAYVLEQSSGFHEVGIRYGAEPSEYYSPHINHYISDLLLKKYKTATNHDVERWKFFWCDCGCYHPKNYRGDCNDVSARYSTSFLEQLYGSRGWDIVPKPDYKH